MIEKIKRIIRITCILSVIGLVVLATYMIFSSYWKEILMFMGVCIVIGMIAWAFDW